MITESPFSLVAHLPPRGRAARPDGARFSGRFFGSTPAWNLTGGVPETDTSRVTVLRVDVDGVRPLLMVSGRLWLTNTWGVAGAHDFLGTLSFEGEVEWAGETWRVYASADVDLPGAHGMDVAVSAGRCLFRLRTQQGPLAASSLERASDWFRSVEIEVDLQEEVSYELSYDTALNNEKLPTWEDQILNIPSTFKRAGIDVTLVKPDPQKLVDVAHANQDKRWDNLELHDAMQKSWERFDDAPNWAMWVLGAYQHVDGEGLGGIMFDGPGSPDAPQRQGAAVFSNALMHNPGPFWENALNAADAKRSRFFSLIHEIGHAFNLAHSWQKALVPSSIPGASSWTPLKNRPDARSWMNYPHEIPGFYDTFSFDFDEEELKFLRHAPESYVRMGGSPFFVDHALQAGKQPPVLVRPSRAATRFEWLEPVRFSAKVINNRTVPIQLPGAGNRIDPDAVQVLVEGRDGVRVLRPYLHTLAVSEVITLEPRESRWLDLYIGGEPGTGNAFPEPGEYRVQIRIIAGGVALANSPVIPVTIEKPKNIKAWRLGAAFSREDTCRLYRFEGSHVLTRANESLAALNAGGAVGSASWRHARLNRENPFGRARRVLERKDQTTHVRWLEADTKRAEGGYRDFLALSDTGAALAAASSNAPYYTDVFKRFATMLGEDGRIGEAAEALSSIEDRLGAQTGSLLLGELQETIDHYKPAGG